jgi:hypothetical protein
VFSPSHLVLRFFDRGFLTFASAFEPFELSVQAASVAGQRRSITVDFYDSLGKGLRGFLRQIVTDAAVDDPVYIFAGEFVGIGTAIRVWCIIGITFKGNGGHGDDRTFGKPLRA